MSFGVVGLEGGVEVGEKVPSCYDRQVSKQDLFLAVGPQNVGFTTESINHFSNGLDHENHTYRYYSRSRRSTPCDVSHGQDTLR